MVLQQQQKPISITQQKMLCKFRQTQLSTCASSILNVLHQLLLYDTTSKKMADVSKWSQEQVHQFLAQIRSPENAQKGFDTFLHKLQVIDECKNLPTLLVQLCQAHIDFMHLSVDVPTNLLERLWNFLINACFEKPLFLHVYVNDPSGTVLDAFRAKLATFCAATLL